MNKETKRKKEAMYTPVQPLPQNELYTHEKLREINTKEMAN